MPHHLAKIVSLIALLAVIIPSILCFMGSMELDTVKQTALIGTIIWFIATPMWMSDKPHIDDQEVEI